MPVVLDDDRRAQPSPELLELVGSSYPLTALEVERDLGGSYNLNLMARAGSGAYVVRVYRPWVTAARLAAIQAVREHLRSRGWPLAPLLRTRSGAGLVELGGRVVEVEAYVPGATSMGTWPALEAGLPWLARLHDALLEAPSSADAAEPLVANHLDASRVHADTASAFEAIRSWADTDAERRFLATAERLADLLAEVDRFDLTGQLVHGDFWLTNVQLSDDRLVRLGDFDFLGARPRVDDLALTLFFANEHVGRDDLSSARIDRLRRLVDAYDAALDSPLSTEERTALPNAIARSPLTFVRDMGDGDRFHRAELVELRGPEYEWAMRVLDDPRWLRVGEAGGS